MIISRCSALRNSSTSLKASAIATHRRAARVARASDLIAHIVFEQRQHARCVLRRQSLPRRHPIVRMRPHESVIEPMREHRTSSVIGLLRRVTRAQTLRRTQERRRAATRRCLNSGRSVCCAAISARRPAALRVGNASMVIDFTALNQRDPIRCCAARQNAESEMPTWSSAPFLSK